LHGAIKQEINDQIDAGETLAPYDHYLISQRDWQALYLYRDGVYQEQSRAACPTAWDFMRNELGDWLCPLLEMHFSVLQAGAAIAPHCDLWNFSLNVHFAVDIPPDCAITVAHETRTWEEGKCLLFDYSFVHEAWNRSSLRRVCLLADVWHPDLSMAERSALTCVITEVRRLMAAA
jgi:aspartyl/asparaginyl beta-hydroxylase (cupin superfamily)